MRMSKMILGLAASLVVAGVSQAAITPSVTAVVPTLSGTPLAGYTGYILTLTPSANQQITTLDFGGVFAGTGGGQTGITGTLHQRWVDATGDGITPNPTGTSKVNYDTHFLFNSTNNTLDGAALSGVIGLATEDNTGAGSPVGASNSATVSSGLGTTLRGPSYGFTAPAGTPINFAYIVIPTASAALIRVNVASNTAGTNTGEGISFVVPVPEPTSAALAGVALLGLAKRRRA